ncbi:hypothetical protein Dda_4479 [Drechslerella dactyloides]|uniref:Uncharacterized protein n=1 Tax=Drechslerella dactyloides TaxID=74499 RepID=A0AAD6IWZ9_DREDA|nr:hypothetical protein Dda_4479 [Drechslerella dactyloides]
MNRLPTAISISARLARLQHRPYPAAIKLTPTGTRNCRPLSTTAALYSGTASPPAGDKERPNLPSDKQRDSESPKSSDEKITDRALEAEKGKAPFTEEEQKRRQVDKEEGIGEGEGEK